MSDVKMTLDSDDTLFSDPLGEQDQMLRDVRTEVQLEYGSMAELVFDRESSSVSSLKEIKDPLHLGFNEQDK